MARCQDRIIGLRQAEALRMGRRLNKPQSENLRRKLVFGWKASAQRQHEESSFFNCRMGNTSWRTSGSFL